MELVEFEDEHLRGGKDDMVLDGIAWYGITWHGEDKQCSAQVKN